MVGRLAAWLQTGNNIPQDMTNHRHIARPLVSDAEQLAGLDEQQCRWVDELERTCVVGDQPQNNE